jgi:glycosyltransferase involved in cell wall biosynthesis
MQKKLTVGFVSPGWPLSQYPNGIVTYLQNLLDSLNNTSEISAKILALNLKQQGFDDKDVLDVTTLAGNESILEKTLDRFWFKVNPMLSIQTLQARKIIKSLDRLGLKLDLLEIEESFGFAAKIIPKVNFPVVTRLHGPWFIHAPILKKETEPGYYERVKNEGEAIGMSHGITAPSLDVLEQVRGFYKLKLPNAVVIPNPVLEVEADQQWGYTKATKSSLLFVGRFDLHKGGDLILDAFRLVALKNPDMTLTFVGPDRGVPIGDNTYSIFEYMQKFITEAHIRSRINYLGHCSSDKIQQLRQQALLTVVTSRYESFSLSLLEALSTGCPVIATAVGGMKEIVRDGYNGVLAETASAEAIAEKIIALLGKPEKMKVLSRNAINDCKAKYHPAIVAKQTLDYYKSLL